MQHFHTVANLPHRQLHGPEVEREQGDPQEPGRHVRFEIINKERYGQDVPKELVACLKRRKW